MTDLSPDIAVLRQGTEGLSTADYATEIQDRLPDYDVHRARTPQEERRLVETAPVVTGITLEKSLVRQAQNLQLFACIYSGVEHLPKEALREQEVTVTNASGIHAPGIAEQAIGNILVFSRRLYEGWDRKCDREWRHYKASELTDCTVTVVGLGSIGMAVVERLRGFGVRTIGVRHTPLKGGPTDEVIGPDGEEFYRALAETDYLILSCPLTDETRGLICKRELVTLPPEAVVVNTARGGIIDTDALVWAIRDSCIRGAALDVTDPEPLPEDHPLWMFDNVLITPHMGGSTPYHWPRLADILAENVRHIETESGTQVPRNQVLPES